MEEENSLTVNVDFFQNGIRVPGTTTKTFTLNPSGHMAKFVNEADVFGTAANTFSGVGTLRIWSSSSTFAAMAIRADGLQYSSLPTEAAAQHWTWTYGSETGSWDWQFYDGYTFIGYEQDSFNSDRVRLRGVVASNYNQFIAEWNYSDTDGTFGQILFIGVPGKEGTTDVINGKRMQVRSDGTIVSTTTFKATRIY